MNPLSAYKSQQTRSIPRIELILASFRKALENLARAREALVKREPDAARACLMNAQLIVSGLASELPAYEDEAAINFLRLYEFVARRLVEESIDGIDAATKVLQPLLEGFEAVREQALTLELEGHIPPLDRPQHVSVNV